MAAMVHGRTIDSFSYGEKMFFLMQNIFTVPVMQHGCCVKPLYMLALHINFYPPPLPLVVKSTGDITTKV